MPGTRRNSLDLAKPPAQTRVVVAMSGGVDSSVVAALLASEGYDVVGVTLQLSDHGATQRKGACCAGQDIHDARRVAGRLGIPHYVLDYEERFKTRVIDSFVRSYVAGETPVPCVSCNSEIKFADLLETARDLGADVLATGHYIAARRTANGDRALFRAADAARDQSYFLYATTAAQLEHLRFPLGDMTKAEVRALAHRFELPVAAKPDSQDICFVPDGKYSAVIARLAPEAASGGEIVHLDGRVLGRHAGIINFTVGQRRGLGLGAQEAGGAPLYVVRLDAARRTVVVGPREALATRAALLRDFNWIGAEPVERLRDGERAVHVRVRSTRAPVPGALTWSADGMRVSFAADEDAVSPGQACVLYDGADGQARVLGGGIIAATEPGKLPGMPSDLAPMLAAAGG